MDYSTNEPIELATLLARHLDAADEIERPPDSEAVVDGYVFSQLTVARLQKNAGNVQIGDLHSTRPEFVLDAQLHYVRSRRDYHAEATTDTQRSREDAIAADVTAVVTSSPIANSLLSHMRAMRVRDDDAAAAAFLAALANQLLLAATRLTTRSAVSASQKDSTT